MYYVTHTYTKFTYPNARQPCVFSTFSMQHKLHTFYFGLFIFSFSALACMHSEEKPHG